MIETIVIGLLCVVLAFLARYKRLSWTFPLAMVILFVFLSIRYYWGNDYEQYIDKFTIYNAIDRFDYSDPDERWEVGWILLYRLFKPFGFFSLVIVLSAFEIGVYYWFIKKYVPREWYWFAIFLYVFNPYFMLVHASMLRQALAMGLVLLSIPYIFKKRFIVAALIIVFASLFHSSAKILLPIVFLGYLNWKMGNKGVIIGGVLFFTILLLQNIVLHMVEETLSSLGLSKYVYYLEEGKETSELATGIGFVYQILMMCMVLYYEKKQDREIGLLFKLTALSFLFIPLGFVAQLFSRLGMYLQVPMIATYPHMVRSIDNKIVRVGTLLLIMAFTVYDFHVFFNSEIYGDFYIEYRTIFESFVWR